MQDRLNQNDVTNRVNVEDPYRVRDAVLSLFAARYPGTDLAPLACAFDDFKALFEGEYPGYLACDTLYHDMRHTLDMSLAMARLVDGYDRTCAEADRLGARRAMLGVLIALLHDCGYLKRNSESRVENGAVFTKVHVSRSADFISAYLPVLGFAAEAARAAKLVHFTGYEMEIEDILIQDPRDRMLGCLVGTADLIGQMSDRMYLEKCREFLYKEFVLGSIARETTPEGREIVRYASPEDLILQTPGFYEFVARAHREKARRRRSVCRSPLRRAKPLSKRDRAQHGLPAPSHRDRGSQAAQALLLLPIAADPPCRVMWGLSHSAKKTGPCVAHAACRACGFMGQGRHDSP